jgi:hypothetical protein
MRYNRLMTPRRWLALARRVLRARRILFGVVAVAVGVAWLTFGRPFDLIVGACWIVLGLAQFRAWRAHRPART